MKHKFSSRELGHIWFHKSDEVESGRCSSHMSFIGNAFLSYSTVIAEKIKVKGQTVVLYNERRFSNTTNRHQSTVRRAIPEGVPVVYVDTGRDEGRLMPRDPENIRLWARGLVSFDLGKAAGLYAKVKRCRSEWSKNATARQATFWYEQAKLVRDLFNKRIKIPEDTAKLAEACEQARKNAIKQEQERQRRYEIERAEDIEKWKRGEKDVYFPSGVERCFLRTWRVEDTEHDPLGGGKPVIQTSKGACIPYADGEKCFRFATLKREKGWHRNGEQFPVGDFQLDAVNEHGVVAGCHRIMWDEIERFAKQEGWLV